MSKMLILGPKMPQITHFRHNNFPQKTDSDFFMEPYFMYESTKK